MVKPLGRQYYIMLNLSISSLPNKQSKNNTGCHHLPILYIYIFIPQMFIFHNVTITYPANFTQCTTRGSFVTHWQETAYNMFTFSCLFLLPLVIMIICYTRIFIQISKRMTKKNCKFTAEPNLRT